MKRIAWLALVAVILGYLIFSTYTSAPIQVPTSKTQSHSEQILSWAQQHLPQTGLLKKNREGYVYLKVDDGYINQLYPLVENPRYRKADDFRRSDSPGAHISVWSGNEVNENTDMPEIGQSFSFTLVDVAYVPPRYRNYLVLQVHAPELEALRQRYGLKPLFKGHQFHITIAKKRR